MWGGSPVGGSAFAKGRRGRERDACDPDLAAVGVRAAAAAGLRLVAEVVGLGAADEEVEGVLQDGHVVVELRAEGRCGDGAGGENRGECGRGCLAARTKRTRVREGAHEEDPRGVLDRLLQNDPLDEAAVTTRAEGREAFTTRSGEALLPGQPAPSFASRAPAHMIRLYAFDRSTASAICPTSTSAYRTHSGTPSSAHRATHASSMHTVTARSSTHERLKRSIVRLAPGGRGGDA